MDIKEVILNSLNHGVNKFNELQFITNINKKELQAILDSMIQEQKVLYDKYYNEYYILKIATLIVKEAGYAFASVEGEEADYYISPDDLLDGYNGDKALVFPYEKGSKLVNARVYKIIERANTTVIGVLGVKKTKKGLRYYVKSNSKSFPVNVYIREDLLRNAKPGNVVYADVYYNGTAINGKIIEVLGYPDDPGMDISQIALEFGFKTPFSNDVLMQIDNIADEVSIEEIKDRKDFRADTVITIDGDDSKDFDDAVYLEALDNGNYKLYVHIADVANYVKEGSPLDNEAFERGTSVYLADRVIPMLPRKLSNGICSLNENVDRLTLSCIMEIDLKGNLVNYEITEGVIKSHHRMTYSNVNKILNGDNELIEKYNDIYEMLINMQKLAHIIRERRYKKGGIEFEVDEYKITLNSDGSPNEITLRVRDEAEKLIEDFMLQANETVAYHMNIMNLPCMYRVHEKPDQEKLHNVFSLISNMGVALKNTKNDIHPKQIQDALEKINESEFAPIINNMLLRSMMKAKYMEKCLGHYGLAMNYYCHFTSPIRRYPDLMVHRIIKNVLLHPNNLDEDIIHFEAILPEIALKNSASERKAIECEREVYDMLYAWYMTKHIKEQYTGIITSLTSFGMFVTLDNGIEGLVAYKDMDGYFDYNESTMTVKSLDRCYKLGQKVDIIVMHASKAARKIEFMLKEDYEEYFGGII